MSPLRGGHFGSKKQPIGSKVETEVVREAYGHEEKSFSVIVKVKADYVPKDEGVRLRTHLSPEMFTAQVTQRALKRLEKDPKVVSISLSRLLTVG